MKHDDDDDTQVQADTLLIVYQRGFADGKAAQRKALTDEEIWEIHDRCIPHTEGYVFPVDFTRAIEAAHNIKEGT
jgi:hypothetical protein